MSENSSLINLSTIYRLYFDDIEEIFLNTISMKYLLFSGVFLTLLTIASVIILIYRSTKIFLACFIPCIYSLIVYDFLQFSSIVLLKYSLWNPNQSYFGEVCRWPYYLKASSEAGQCLTLLLLYVVRRQKLRYFFKHHYLPNSSRIHARALTLVAFLFIVYVNNWITHLKVEKIHLITSNNGIDIQEYPITLYDSANDSKLQDRRQFYLDLDRYAAHRYQPKAVRPVKPDKIIHNQKDDSIHEVIIKIPYNNFFSPKKSLSTNGSRRRNDRRRLKVNRTISTNNSYRIHRCTYGQRNFFLSNLISLIHALFYLLLLSYFLTTVYRQRIPPMTVGYHQQLCERALSMGRKKSADRHQQLILLTHLKHFQYLIVCCHTALTLIRLLYISLLILILWFVQSPFRWLTMRMFFYSLFLIVYYSIPIRILLLFLYLFLSLFSSSIHSIFSYIFYTKLHCSCQFRRPSVRFRLHLRQYKEQDIHPDEHSTNSLVIDVASSIYDEHSTAMPNESIGFYEETTISSVLPVLQSIELSKTVI